jgi:hypothetical protein
VGGERALANATLIQFVKEDFPGMNINSVGHVMPPASVIVNDLDALRLLVRPSEADSVFIVQPNAVLTRTIALQLFQPIASKARKIIQRFGRVQACKLMRARSGSFTGSSRIAAFVRRA